MPPSPLRPVGTLLGSPAVGRAWGPVAMNEPALIALTERIAAALERLAPPPTPGIDLAIADAFVWEARGERLRPVPRVAGVPSTKGTL